MVGVSKLSGFLKIDFSPISTFEKCPFLLQAPVVGLGRSSLDLLARASPGELPRDQAYRHLSGNFLLKLLGSNGF